MASRVLTTNVCDYCTVESPATSKVAFSVGSISYEADVCDKHKKSYDKDSASWINGAVRKKKARLSSKV